MHRTERDRGGLAAADGERRLVTVLFGDLVGYTTMSESRDPELIQDSLNFCFQALSEEIGRFGGYVDKVVGDEIMALFGAPRAQEDDAGKAIAAGLAIQRRLAQLNPELERRIGAGLKIRIGINTGLVATGAVGPGGYTVTGAWKKQLSRARCSSAKQRAASHAGSICGVSARN